MTNCPSIAYIVVNGAEVAMIPCTLERGHDDPAPAVIERHPNGQPYRIRLEPTPHAHTLTWTNPEGLLDSWPEWSDPDESFDLEVDVAPDEVIAQQERNARANLDDGVRPDLSLDTGEVHIEELQRYAAALASVTDSPPIITEAPRRCSVCGLEAVVHGASMTGYAHADQTRRPYSHAARVD